MGFLRAEYKDGKGVYRNPLFPEAKITADIFWNSLPPEIRKMRDMDLNKRQEHAVKLLQAGFIVPYQVAVLDWEPVTWIYLCYNGGFRWVPSMGEPDIPVMPGLVFPGAPNYEPDRPPPRSITISIDPKDYPPFDRPEIPVIPNAPIVGNYMGAGFYGRGIGATPATVENGKEYKTLEGKTVFAHVGTGLMGWSVYFKEGE